MTEASLEYHITDNGNGILEKKVIQKFYIGSKYFYALQLQASNKMNVVFFQEACCQLMVLTQLS